MSGVCTGARGVVGGCKGVQPSQTGGCPGPPPPLGGDGCWAVTLVIHKGLGLLCLLAPSGEGIGVLPEERLPGPCTGD